MGEKDRLKKVIFIKNPKKIKDALLFFGLDDYSNKKTLVKLHMGEVKNKYYTKPDFVRLIIYDMLGREIQTLVTKHQPVSEYHIDFSTLDVPGGVYLYRLQVGNDFSQTKKMLYLK